MAQNGWTDQEAEIQEDAIWGFDPDALYHMTRAEYKTEPDKIAIEVLLKFFNKNQRETYITTAENSFGQNRTKSKHLKNFWRRLIEIEKECALEGITAADLLVSKFMTAITDTKLADKLL